MSQNQDGSESMHWYSGVGNFGWGEEPKAVLAEANLHRLPDSTFLPYTTKQSAFTVLASSPYRLVYHFSVIPLASSL